MNKIFGEKELMSYCKHHKSIYIYGAGFVEKIFLDRSKNICNSFSGMLQIKGFIVSKKEKDIIQINGVPIICIDEYINSVYAKEDNLVVVAVKEENQNNIIRELEKNNIVEYICIANECITDMLIRQNNDFSIINKRIEKLEQSYIRMIPKPAINISYHLTDACNLNCKGCWHFSPLAKFSEKDVASLDEFEQDIARLADVMEGEVTLVSLFGGEPLLHPKAYLFPYIVKKYLPDTYIDILTNGLLLLNQDELFWKSCEDNKVTIEWTQYPVNKNQYIKIEHLLKGKNVEFRHFGEDETKCLTHDVIDILAKGNNGQKGRNDARYQWLHCFRAGDCVQLKNHKLYPCSTAANAHLLKDYYGLNMRLSPSDGIDIYKVSSKEEITSFLAKPIPFCRYCNVEKAIDGNKWCVSERKLEEWT